MRKGKTKAKITGLYDDRGIQQTYGRSSTSRNVEPLEVPEGSELKEDNVSLSNNNSTYQFLYINYTS